MSRRAGRADEGARLRALAVVLAVLCAGPASAEEPAVSGEAEEDSRWHFESEALYVHRLEDSDYVTGTMFVDGDTLHLEGRFNYEDLGTVSAFVGWSLFFGQRLELELTPMLGGVVGKIEGVAPGLELALSYWRLELWSENEYVLVPADTDASFFYTWTELYLWPVSWARLGVNLQWTRVNGAHPVAERGFHAGLTYRSVSVAAYVFNPGADNASNVFLLSVDL